MTRDFQPSVVVVGLGYVGLPLAIALARSFPVIGFDINSERIEELRRGEDRTGEVGGEAIRESSLELTWTAEDCMGAQIYIVTVPTPVDEQNQPDLRPVASATKMVGKLLNEAVKPIVVYESTVYPGVTEDFCGPLLSETSGLVCGTDFFLGYSPERINPGDREHTIDQIVKVICGQNAEVTDVLARLYGTVTKAGVFRAASIKAAEAAKIIENAQRDVNIAFMNEITQIFALLGLSIWDVLDAANTKWNFLPFRPGLVGGHCIGVDPYYLSHLASKLGHESRVILAGRETNDSMANWVVERLQQAVGHKPGKVLLLGVTFKENVPDIRNSKAVEIIAGLVARGHEVIAHDPLANAAELEDEYGIELDPHALEKTYDLVVCAVAHDAYRALDAEFMRRLVRPGGIIADLKGVWRNQELPVPVWSL